MLAAYVCPRSHGAHRFAPDAHGVPICACGEIELSVDDQLTLIEVQAGALSGADPRRRRQFYERMAEIMRDHHPDRPDAFGSEWVDQMLTEEH